MVTRRLQRGEEGRASPAGTKLTTVWITCILFTQNAESKSKKKKKETENKTKQKQKTILPLKASSKWCRGRMGFLWQAALIIMTNTSGLGGRWEARKRKTNTGKRQEETVGKALEC